MAVGSLIISCFCMVLSCLLAELLRLTINCTIQNELAKILSLEFTAAAELCAVCFELIVVAEEHGIWVYGILLFLLTIWWASHWQDASGCPYMYLESYIEGTTTFTQSFLCCLAQMAGGIAIYRYVQYLWDLQLSDTHVNRSLWDCEADLHVPVHHGALIEGVATCLCRIASRFIADIEPRFGNTLDAFIGTSLVVAACDYSGGYFNPVLATSLKLNCRGHTTMEHFIVYWVGSIGGSVFSFWLYQNTSLKDKILSFTNNSKKKTN